MKGKNSKSTSKIFIIFTLFCFILIVFRTSYLALSTNIDGINIKEFANDRTIVKTLNQNYEYYIIFFHGRLCFDTQNQKNPEAQEGR